MFVVIYGAKCNKEICVSIPGLNQRMLALSWSHQYLIWDQLAHSHEQCHYPQNNAQPDIRATISFKTLNVMIAE